MSAAQPLYIDPYVKDKDTFISGDHNAQSPALFAFYQAMQNGKDPSKIRVVSVGAFYERAEKITSKTSLTSWISRLFELRTDNKAYSMDYLL